MRLITFLNPKKVNCREGDINDLNKGARTPSVLDGVPTRTDTGEGEGEPPLSEPGAVPAAELLRKVQLLLGCSPAILWTLCLFFGDLFSPSTNLADPRSSLTSTSSSTPTSRLPGPKMSCRKRCKREIFKFAQYLFRLVTGTLNIGKSPTGVFGRRSSAVLLTFDCWFNLCMVDICWSVEEATCRDRLTLVKLCADLLTHHFDLLESTLKKNQLCISIIFMSTLWVATTAKNVLLPGNVLKWLLLQLTLRFKPRV